MSYKIILQDKIPIDLAKQVAEIDEFKGLWQSLKAIAPDRLSILRKIATIASIGSSTRIEGSKLSDSQVEALLSGIGAQSFTNRDEEEVAGYSDAMNMIFDSYKEIAITENHIKQLHKVLLRHSTKDSRHKGEYKQLTNNVEAFDADGISVGIIFETATPFQTPRYMRSLVDWYNEQLKQDEHHALILIATFVVHFLAIHPFQDGNGRLSRILTTLMLLKQGYSYVPYCSIESIVEANKESYYLSLRRAQQSFKKDHIELTGWHRFFIETLKKQKNILRKKIEQEQLLSLDKLPVLDIDIIKITKDRTKVTLSDLVILTKTNRNTVKKHTQSLVMKGLLKIHGTGKGSWYSI